MTTDPGLPNLPEDAGYGSVVGPAEWNAHAERINDVEDQGAGVADRVTAVEAANADDQERIRRGTVATAAATVAKVATLAEPAYVPKAGDLFLIEFTAGHTATGPTLSINGSPALPITSASGSTSSAHTALAAGVEALILHDGTTYRLLTGNSTVWGAFTAAELQSGSGSTRLVTPLLLATNFLNLAAAKPASSTAAGRLGQYWLDATGLYVCVATNTWRLFTGATF
ncbi:hypothetical protein PBI_LEMURIA_18 [Mycobacterium phage Lemuria]|uniref:Minor tail protein n=1 Tax=Mycobacterium phage Lemuria TaxID=2599868 RepID=A0A5J6TI65_9CAUD|nr:hypothetical protein KDW76_gp18 [Mycobacterium phage Lemuria]QFG10098.1 hypothetical protein PBI_LEMURIA_18 [Mycobacterium phage Lemuria]